MIEVISFVFILIKFVSQKFKKLISAFSLLETFNSLFHAKCAEKQRAQRILLI